MHIYAIGEIIDNKRKMKYHEKKIIAIFTLFKLSAGIEQLNKEGSSLMSRI